MFKKMSIGLISLALLLSACSPAPDEQTPSSPPTAQTAPLRIGLLSIDDSLPFFVAKERGLFDKHGVQVELVPFGSAADKEAALEAGALDGDMTDLIVTALLQKGGTPVKIVSIALGATPAEGRFVVLGAPNAALRTVDDLAGVPIAVGENTIVDYISHRVAAQAGIASDAIVTQNIPSLSLRFEALMSGAVQAAVLPDPLASLALLRGATALYDDTQGEVNLSQSIVLFTQQAIDTRADDIDRALDACYEAMTYLSENPDSSEVRQAVSTFSSVPDDLFEQYATPTFTPNALPTPAQVADVMDWMTDKGLLDAPYAYEQLVEPSFVS